MKILPRNDITSLFAQINQQEYNWGALMAREKANIDGKVNQLISQNAWAVLALKCANLAIIDHSLIPPEVFDIEVRQKIIADMAQDRTQMYGIRKASNAKLLYGLPGSELGYLPESYIEDTERFKLQQLGKLNMGRDALERAACLHIIYPNQYNSSVIAPQTMDLVLNELTTFLSSTDLGKKIIFLSHLRIAMPEFWATINLDQFGLGDVFHLFATGQVEASDFIVAEARVVAASSIEITDTCIEFNEVVRDTSAKLADDLLI